MPTKEPQSLLPWVIVGVLGFMLLRNQPQSPKPDPKPSVGQIVQKMMRDTSDGYAREFEKAASNVASGELKNEEQLHKQLKENLDAVRSLASDDLNRIMDSNIPTEFDDGNRGAVSTFLRSVANGFK